MITYLLHASLLIGLLYGFYRLLLSGETFFGFHRWILLGGIALAFGLPLISIPSSYSLKEIIVNNPVKEIPITTTDQILNNPSNIHEPIVVNELSLKSTQKKMAPEFMAPENGTSSVDLPLPEKENSSIKVYLTSFSISEIVAGIYGVGAICLLLYLCFQLFLLAKFRRRGEITSSGRYTIVEHDDCDQSFSFGRVIYLHKSADKVLDRDHIIKHEMIHARQLHSVDIIIGELLTIVLWFNPFAWMYKRAMRDNLEFLTDRQMLDEGADTKAYQLSLVRITVPHTLSQMRQPSAAVALANNYNHSTLKQRIIMMNKKYSSYAKVWRHLMILPILGITMAVCNNVIAEQASSEQAITSTDTNKKSKAKAEKTAVKDQAKIQAKRPQTQSELKSLNSTINADVSTDLNGDFISEVVATAVSNAAPNAMITALDEAFNSEEFIAIRDEQFKNVPKSKEGEIMGRWEIEDHCIHFWMRGKNYSSNWTDCNFDLSGFTQSSKTISRDAGKLTLTESSESDFREGRFTFEASASFQTFLESHNISGINDREMLHLFNTDINKQYITFLTKKGFNPRRSEVVSLAIHSIDEEDLSNKIKALESRDFKTNDLKEIIAMGIHNVDGEYMDEIDALGFKHRKVEDYISMRIHDVNEDLVMSLKNAGYTDLTSDEIVSMAIHDVNEDFVNDLADAGYRNLPVNKIVSMAIHDVNPQFIKEVNEMDLGDLDIDELIGLAIHDVDEDFLIELKEAGMTDLDVDEVISFAIHDIDGEYIDELIALGLRDLSPKDILNGKIHNVRPGFIEDIKNLGFDDLEMDDLINLRIHDIDVRDIERMKEEEGEKRDLSDYSRRIRRRNR